MPTPRRLAAFAVLILALSLMGPPARAGEGETFVCTFGDGDAFSFEEMGFAHASVKPLDLRISGVVPGADKAELKTDAGTAPLKVVQALGARHFLEVAVEGYLVITTIYERAGADGAFAAVHSRHLAVIGEPFVAQYRGTCRMAG
jgi:hypothetical protein